MKRAARIFEALALHYGATRVAAHWNGLDPERAKAYWGAKLDGVPSEAVLFVLKNLPQIPPNVDEFLAIAARAPRTSQLKLLDVPVTPKEVALERLAAMKRMFPKLDPASYPKAEPLIHETTEVTL